MPRNRQRHLSTAEFRLRVYLGIVGVLFVITMLWTAIHG